MLFCSMLQEQQEMEEGCYNIIFVTSKVILKQFDSIRLSEMSFRVSDSYAVLNDH